MNKHILMIGFLCFSVQGKKYNLVSQSSRVTFSFEFFLTMILIFHISSTADISVAGGEGAGQVCILHGVCQHRVSQGKEVQSLSGEQTKRRR